MNRLVNAIAGRLSLRPPQRQSLELLDRLTELIPLTRAPDLPDDLAKVSDEFPSVTDFEREFPSVCFALATGVGKTRLMGAFITYLHLAHGINDFFVLAPNLTIYDKLIADFTPNTPKYVFKGIAEFATAAPAVITGDNYEASAGTLFDELLRCKVNIFNISKINSEVRGGRSPRIRRLSEYIGQSYFDYLAELPKLVLLMDESHRYRASAGVRAINELKPVLGLELTATPFTERPGGTLRFQNVVYDYPLARAMADGFVKEPAVVTRKDFSTQGMSEAEVETIKLEDGIRLHESVKVELETYARETGNPIVKPFLLVIARDTTHAGQLVAKVQSDAFFGGRYRDKVIQVDSSQRGAAEDAMVDRLLKVEQADEPTEIVVHVNMLKEGWDVTNLYTIVPLRAANARTLIEQSIGRGLRLPYGKRTGVSAVDRLNIVAHDRFQEIVDEAGRPESIIQMQQIILDAPAAGQRAVTVVSRPRLAAMLGLEPEMLTPSTQLTGDETPAFDNPVELSIAQIAYDVVSHLDGKAAAVPSVAHLSRSNVQAMVVKEVLERIEPGQLELDGVTQSPDVAAIVAKTLELKIRQTIDIPRISVVPRGEVRSGFHPFTLALGAINYPAPSHDLWIQHLRTHEREVLSVDPTGGDEASLEDYVVRGLMDFDDISYDDHAELLYDLAGQVVAHVGGYLPEDDARRVLQMHQRPIRNLVHAQMQEHYWEDATGYDVIVRMSFEGLKESAYTSSEPPLDYRQRPPDLTKMASYRFGGFARCLYSEQKFASDSERQLAVILEREAEKWFKPARGQFQIYYRWGSEQPEYQPDFVAEMADAIYMLEPKAANQMTDAEVLAKKDAAVTWCKQASDHTVTFGGKPWRYALIPHDSIAENATLDGLMRRFGG